MASAPNSSMKREAEELFALISCALCEARFNDAERAPRSLGCGHSFCTVCVQARIQQPSARKWNIACSTCSETTEVKQGHAAKLGKNFAQLALISALEKEHGRPFPFRIHIKTMGGEMLSVLMRADELVSDLKQRVFALHNEFKIARQRLAVMLPDGEHEVLQPERALVSYPSISSESTVALMMTDGFGGGTFVRSIGSPGNGAGEFCRPRGISLSQTPDGLHLFVADTKNNRVQVFSALDGGLVLIRTVLFKGQPSDVCVLGYGEVLLAVDTNHHSLDVMRASDGSCLRSVGTRGSGPDQFRSPYGCCVSPDGEYLFVADSANDRVQMLRAADFEYVRSFGGRG